MLGRFELVGTFKADGFSNTSSYGQVAPSGEGWYVAAGSQDGRVFVWDVRKGSVAEILKGEKGRAHEKDQVHAVAWSQHGAPLVSGDKTGYLVLWR